MEVYSTEFGLTDSQIKVLQSIYEVRKKNSMIFSDAYPTFNEYVSFFLHSVIAFNFFCELSFEEKLYPDLNL